MATAHDDRYPHPATSGVNERLHLRKWRHQSYADRMTSLSPVTRWVLSILALVLSGVQAFLPVPAQVKSLLGTALMLFAAIGIVPPHVDATVKGK